MTKRIPQIVAVAVTALAFSFNAAAQPSGGFGITVMPITVIPPSLLANIGTLELAFQKPELAKQLELTPQQTTVLQKITRDAMATLSTSVLEAFGPMPQNHEEAMQRLADTREKIGQRSEIAAKEAQEKIDQILKPEQQTKLRKLAFQIAGGLKSPVLDERLLEFLNLTDAQKEPIRKLAEESLAEIRLFMERATDRLRDRETPNRVMENSVMEDMEQIGVRYAERITALLTAEQRAKAEKLTAEIPALSERLGLPIPGQPRAPRAGQ